MEHRVKTAPAAEICVNCGRTIGILETPHVYKDSVVCHDCLRKITSSKSDSLVKSNVNPPAATAQAPSEKTKGAVERWLYSSSDPVCPNPNCGHRGRMKKSRTGSIFVELAFFVGGIVFGVFTFGIGAVIAFFAWLFYYGTARKKQWRCPKCRFAWPR